MPLTACATLRLGAWVAAFTSAAFGSSFAADPAPEEVTLLVPGITARRLPVKLNNINSVEYAPDGRLFAVGYDGRIHLLRDTDGDGLEDQALPFWDKKGDLLTPVGIVVAPEGIYVPARGKVVLFSDTDNDGKADKSETVASGWVQERYNGATRNDASGVAMDAAGNLYFCLGCSDYRDGFLLDEKGKAQYRRDVERGAVLKVSADRQKREIFASGLRFVTGLRFNRHGDLFGTDQEGDTWFPGGNRRDELLHLIKGRHYGFPFRHPKHLPDVIDEPAVVDFEPQHQSTCGFRFNEVTSSTPKIFGPDFWSDDALVTGFSRGKLWRSPLAKNRAGYVGRQIQIAAFNTLPTDVTLSPTGDVVVTAHSGRPDWGSGPKGEAFLFKLSYSDPKAAQPVMAWADDPLTVTVAFDRPVDLKQLEGITVRAGEFIREGDRYETIQPGYKVVTAANEAPTHDVKILRTQLSEDRRSAILTTSPLPWRANYVVSLPEIGELSLQLTGAIAEWTAAGDSKPTLSTWIPHFDLTIASQWMRGSSVHEHLQQLWKREGTLTLRSLLSPPSAIDENASTELRFEASNDFTVTLGKKTIASSRAESGRFQALATLPDSQKEAVELRIETATHPAHAPDLDLSYHTSIDPNERAIPTEKLSLPWASKITPSDADTTLTKFDWRSQSGDPAKGKVLFATACATCHQYKGEGKNTGPDLTTSLERDPAAVLRDIIDPSAAINPDYVAYLVDRKAGAPIFGTLQNVGEPIMRVYDGAGTEHKIAKADVLSIEASPVSLMPAGFAALGDDQLADIVAYLCGIDPDREARAAGAGNLTLQLWRNIPKVGGIAPLLKDPRYPGKPDVEQRLPLFEAPSNWDDNFGARMAGFVRAPLDGDYTFWIAGDDFAELWLSESDDPTNKRKIAWTSYWTKPRDWDLRKEQKSKPITLVAGKSYFIEALLHEQGVDDCLAVGWKLPNGKLERPIPGYRLSPDSAIEHAIAALPASEKSKRLFNGVNLTGWAGADNFWTAENGTIRATNTRNVPANTYLFTEDTYADFRLLLEVKQVISDQNSPKNSALAIGGERIADQASQQFGYRGPLVFHSQKWGSQSDANSDAKIITDVPETIGDWNRVEILVKGGRLRMAVNGKPIIDISHDRKGKSPIGLQLSANQLPQEFFYRSLVISEAPGDDLVTVGD